MNVTQRNHGISQNTATETAKFLKAEIVPALYPVVTCSISNKHTSSVMGHTLLALWQATWQFHGSFAHSQWQRQISIHAKHSVARRLVAGRVDNPLFWPVSAGDHLLRRNGHLQRHILLDPHSAIAVFHRTTLNWSATASIYTSTVDNNAHWLNPHVSIRKKHSALLPYFLIWTSLRTKSDYIHHQKSTYLK